MKYPKTMHLLSSPNLQNDDRRIESMERLIGQEVVITEKLDGENTSFHFDKVHVRSEDEMERHPSRSIIKAIWGAVRYQIPPHIQIVGENLYAKHSIYYDRLTDFFYVFAVIDKERKVFLSVDDTLEWCNKLALYHVPILFRGHYGGEDDFMVPASSTYGDECEGYVVRDVKEIPVDEWKVRAAKYVRAKHVKTTEHWKTDWIPNKLR
jgi:hypothetical protein